MSQNYLSIYAKSFNWAGFFLPKSKYNNCSTLYDFCRTVDNIADEEENLDIKKKNFKEFKKRFYEKDFSSIKIRNMWQLIHKFSISTKIIDDLFDGIETDLQEKVLLSNEKDLLIYSYRVAGTVGLMMAKILKVKSNLALTSAIDLGIAMQLTNIARDVIEDADRNREYIDNNFNKIKETIKRSGKIFVTKLGKVKETFLSIYDFILLLFLKPNKHNLDFHHINIRREINLDDRF